MNKQFALPVVLGMAAMTGCAPSIDSVTVTPGADANVVNVEAVIRDAALITLQTPTVSVAALPAANPFANAGNMTNVSGSQYRRENLAFVGGQYRVRVTVPYKVIFTPGTSTKTREVDFTVDVPAGCFYFDQGFANWSANGFFGINSSGPQDDGTQVNICSGQSPLMVQGTNYPGAYSSVLPGNFRSIGASLGSPCFSNPQPVPANNLVVYDFVSPPLASTAGWENATGYELYAGAFSFNVAPQNPIRMQLIFIDTNGQARPQVDANGNRVFHNLSSQFQNLSMTRPGFEVERIRARVFVPGGVTYGGEEYVAIDRVCPRN